MLELMFSGSPAAGGMTLINGQRVISSLSVINTTWTVPTDVFEISVVVVGAGGLHGRGGDLRWIKQVRVTPGEVLTIALGGSNDTVISRGSTDILRARCGLSTNSSTPISLPDIGGGNGGAVGTYGGGGAGGYSGNGGDGYSNTTVGSGSGGGGGGGGGGGWVYNSKRWGGGGGGVGLLGPGANGIAGVITSSAPTTANYGGGGSGGANGQGTSGGNYGGSASATSGVTIGAAAIRIIWGPDRAYPSSNVADMT